MSLLSLPHSLKGAFKTQRVVSPLHRSIAAAEIRKAVCAGKVSAAEVASACRSGDAGVARLMLHHHVLTTDVAIDPALIGGDCTPEKRVAATAMSWARSLVAAGRLRDEDCATLPRKNVLAGLIELCIRSSMPAACAHNRSADESGAVAFVSHTYLEALRGGAGLTRDAEPRILVEQIHHPLFNLPDWLKGDDLRAVLSVVHAIAQAEPFGLLVAPAGVPWALNGWYTELFEDGRNSSRRGEDGVWELAPDFAELLNEELGIDVSDPDCAADMGLHLDYLASVSQLESWRIGGTQMQAWRRGAVGTPVGDAVARLLGILKAVLALKIDPATVEVEFEGDPVGVMVALPGLQRLTYFSAEDYGMNDVPVMSIKPVSPRQNPSAFWALHEAVVMVVNLITETGHVIEGIQQEHQFAAQELCRAA
jgi:hypothetical protein